MKDRTTNPQAHSDLHDERVIKLQNFLKRAGDYRRKFEPIWRALEEFYEEAFIVAKPKGKAIFDSQLAHTVITSMLQSIGPIDFDLLSSGMDDRSKRVVGKATEDVMRRGNWREVKSAGFSLDRKMLALGSAFVKIGFGEKDGQPIRYEKADLLDVWIDPDALEMRSVTGERDVDEAVVRYKYSLAEFERLYPAWKNKVQAGKLPVADDQKAQSSGASKSESEGNKENPDIEVMHWYEKSERVYRVVAGSTATIIVELTGSEYPFVFEDDTAYIPLQYFSPYPSTKDFYGYGPLHPVYKLGIISRKLMSAGFSNILENADPIRTVRVPKGESESFFNSLVAAHSARTNDNSAIVPIEVDQQSPSGIGDLGTFTTTSLLNEWSWAKQEIESMIGKLGVNPAGVVTDPRKPFITIEFEAEKQNDHMRQIIDQNAAAYRFVIDVAVDAIKKFVDADDPTIIDHGEKIVGPDGTEEAVPITLGMVANDLRQPGREVQSQINSANSVVNSRQIQRVRLGRSIQSLPSGSPAQAKVMAALSKLDNMNFSPSDFVIPASAAPASIKVPSAKDLNAVDPNNVAQI